MAYLTDQVKIVKVKDHSAADTASIVSDSVDMAADGGYENVVFMTSFGTAAAGNKIKAQSSSDDGAVDAYSDLTGTSVTSGTSDEDVVLEVFRPTERYVRCYASLGTSSTLESIWALRWRSRNQPITTNVLSGTLIQEQWASPAEGGTA